MDAQCVWDIADDLIRIEVYDHDMGTSGYVQTPGRAINREIIPAAFTADFEPFDYVVSGISSIAVSCENQTEENYEFFHFSTI